MRAAVAAVVGNVLGHQPVHRSGVAVAEEEGDSDTQEIGRRRRDVIVWEASGRCRRVVTRASLIDTRYYENGSPVCKVLTVVTVGQAMRAARTAAGMSLAVMAARTHYSKSYLSLVESGRRAATDDVVGAYERVLGIGGLDEVDRGTSCGCRHGRG